MTDNSQQTTDDTPTPKIRYSLRTRLLAYLQLTRPANIITAIADILAGFAISGSTIQIVNVGNGWFYIPELSNLILLIISTIGLYGGGVVLNDFFDAELDLIERPERPIPSGKASKIGAFIWGVLLLSIGIQAASFVSFPSVLIAIAIASLAVLYDAWGKHQTYFGPLNMGLCRGGNLLLGVSAFTPAIFDLWFISLIPVIYIAAVTVVSRGEVHGDNGKSLRNARWMYSFVILLIMGLAFHHDFQLRPSLPILVLFGWMIFGPLRKAQISNEPKDIGKAVKFGVLALILMDAAIAAGFAGWDYALVVVCLLPGSLVLSRVFAVT